MLKVNHTVILRQTQKILKRFIHATIDDPVVPPNVVTLLGDIVPTTKTMALLLKQCSDVEEIRLYGKDRNVCATALDLAEIDTNPKVIAYKGDNELLKESILDARVIVVCGGLIRSPFETDEDLLHRNISMVRNIAIHCAEYNPQAILLVATPPINSFVPLISEEYKKAKVYDPRKIIGVTSFTISSANTIIANYLKENPLYVNCPVLGGDCSKTRVPILSQCVPSLDHIKEEDRINLYKSITTSFRTALSEKYNNRMGPMYLTSAYSLTRFVTNVLRALDGQEGIYDCAFVRQTGHIDTFLPYMQSIVLLGREGIAGCFMPNISSWECEKLMEAHPFIKKAIHAGSSVVNGEVKLKRRSEFYSKNQCPISKIVKEDHVGDVVVDLSKTYRHFEIYR